MGSGLLVILAGPIDAIDDEHVSDFALAIELQPELLLECSEYRCRVRICQVASNRRLRAERDLDVIEACEAGAIHDGPAGYRLAELEPSAALPPVDGGPLTASTGRPPLLTPLAAAERLEAMDLPFVFFRDADRGRGEVVHRRRDGAYGLVLPPV